MKLSDNKIDQILAGIDRVSEKATQLVSTIDKDALTDAKVQDLYLSDVQARVQSKNVNPGNSTNTQKSDKNKKVTLS